MPNRPIDFKFTSDVVNLLNGLGKTELSVEDLEQAFVEASNSSADLERKINRATRLAEQDVEKLERAIRDVGDATGDAARESVQGFDRIGDAAGEAGSEVGSEFRQNLGETLASGGGIGDIFADTLGGLASSMQGAAAGIFAPMAVAGLVVFNQIKSSWDKIQADIAASAESMWGTVMSSLGDQIGQVAANISETILVQEELARLWQEAPDDMAELVRQAELLGINSNDVLLAHAGDEQAIMRVNTALRESEERTENYLGMTADTIQAHEGIKGAIYKGHTAMDITQAKLDAYNDSLPAVAAAHELITAEIGKWATGVQKTQQQIEILRAAFYANPLDLTVRLHVDAAALRQYFPYGVGGGGTDEYLARYGPPENG